VADDESRRDLDLLRRLRGMSVQSAAQQLEAFHRLKERARPAAEAAGWRAPADDPRAPDAIDLGFDTVRFALETLECWKRLEGRHFDFLLRGLGAAAEPSRTDPAAASPTPRVLLEVTASDDLPGRARFRVENPSAATDLVLIEVPALRGASDGGAFGGSVRVWRADVDIDPDDFAVPAGGLGVFELVVGKGAAPAGRFVGTGTVRVGGRDAGVLVINARVV
jgi:hypothetical protein